MATLESVLKAIENKIDREVNLFNSEFEKILKLIGKEVEIRSIQNLSSPLEFDYEFQRILNDTGYYALVDNFINNSYDMSYNDILLALDTVGLSTVFTPEDLDSILATKQIDLEFFRQIGNDAANRLKSDLNKYSLSNLSIQDMTENIRETLADTNLAKHSRTYADTLISNYNQVIIDLKSAGVTDEVYIYVGVDDKATRKFCKCLVEQKKFYDRSDSQKIKNDKRREYNCRHTVMPVTKEYAIAEGYHEGNFTC